MGTETRAGRDTYHYRATASGALANPALREQLPSSLPRTLAPRLLALLPPATQQKLLPLVSALPDQVPLSYTASSTYDVWADSALGAPLDTKINRSVVANVGAGAASIPLLPVLTIDVTEDQASIQAAADRVSNADRLLSWIELWGPLVLLILGLVVVALGLWLGRRKPSQPGAEGTRTDVGSPAPS